MSQLRFGVYDAVSNFNIGRKATVLKFEAMKMKPGQYLLPNCNNLNGKRLYHSNYKNTNVAKKRRKVIRGQTKAKHDKRLEKDGVSYECGAY